MTWYNVADRKFGCPSCGCTETQIEMRVMRTEVRTRSAGDFDTNDVTDEITGESEESCNNCGAAFDEEQWGFGLCPACGGAGYDCEDLDHCTRCDQLDENCECERAECCENFTDECECKESEVKEKDNTIEKAVQVIENIHYESVETRILAKVVSQSMFKDPTGNILADIVSPFGLKKQTAPTPDPVPDKNRVQTPAANWRLPEDLPEE